MAAVSYIGHKDANGVCHVLRDGRQLALKPSLLVWNHSPTGFNWGYMGSGPAQLALALLLDATHDKDIAARYHQAFKSEYVANWSSSATWQLTDAEIRAWVEEKIDADPMPDEITHLDLSGEMP